MDKLSVGRFIAEQRKAKELTQKQLAEELNVTDKAVSKWETGRSYPDVEMLERLSAFFGVTVNDVLSGKVIAQTDFAEEADKNVVQAMKDTKKTKSVFKGVMTGLVLCPVVLGIVFGILNLALCIPVWFAESEELDGVEVIYNNLLNTASVSCYIADSDKEDFIITVPDECNDIPVTKIGYDFALLAAPFYIDMDSYTKAPEDSKYYNTCFTSDMIAACTDGELLRIEDVVFKMYIGKNIKKIKDVNMDYYYPYINEDSSITFYHPVVEIYCSEENKYFYSADGKLYKKSDNSLVRNFEYAYY